jgi:hypothetical protein
MYLNGHTEIWITSMVDGVEQGDAKKLETVVSIEATNDWSHIGANCDIVVPLTVRIVNQGQYLIDNVRNLFKSGDRVLIKSWYSEYLEKAGAQIIFDGFIYDFLEGNPLTIRCVDYVYNLKKGVVNLNFEKENSDNVIKAILEGTGITPYEENVTIDKITASFNNMSPAACLEWLKNESKLTITLIGKKLYMNIAMNTLKTVKLKTDVNVIRCDMQKPDGAFQKFKVNAWIKKEDGTKEMVEIGDADGRLRESKLFFIDSESTSKDLLINNTLENHKFAHYTGKITTLLYPESDLFWAVDFEDVRYPERSAIYTIKSNVVTLTKDGFRRELTVAYLTERDAA